MNRKEESEMSHTNPLPELPEPFVHCYEWKDLRNGTRRSFSAAPYNGMRCSNSLALFTAEQFQAVQREAYDLGARSTAAQPVEPPSTMQDTTGTQALWPQMIAALAAIDAELELPEDGCNSLTQTLAAIRKLKAAPLSRGELTDADIYAIANDGFRNAAGGIYATRVYDFALAVLAASGDSTPPSEPACETCKGVGMIGGFVNADSGYDGMPCPECSPQGDPSGALRPEAEAAGQGRWQLIETAPKDGTEVLAYREDCGPFIARWTNAAELMTTEEMEREQLDDETLFAEDWFYADFIQGGRADGSEAPTHWMPLPEPPPAAPGGPAGARRPDENSPSGPSDRALNPQPEAVDRDRGAR